MDHAQAQPGGAAALYDPHASSALVEKVRTLESKVLLRLLGPLIGVETLDLGCGTGYYAEKMRERGAEVLGVDSSPAMLAALRKRGFTGKKQDVGSLSLGRKFRVILAARLLEFLPDENRFFRLALAHCHPDGRLVLLVGRPGWAGWLYSLQQRREGRRALVRPLKRLREAARKAGWRLDKARRAGPVAVALRFRPAAQH